MYLPRGATQDHAPSFAPDPPLVTQNERDLLVARIVSGTIPVCVDGIRYTVRHPDREERLRAEEVFQEAFEQGVREGMLDEEGLLEFLWEAGLWDESKEKALLEIPQDIEKLKVGLYEARFNEKEQAPIRKGLENARKRWLDLEYQRHSHDHTSCSGFARQARLRYRVAVCLYRGPTPVFTWNSYQQDSSGLLDEVIAQYTSLHLSEAQYRELARTSPWRPLWQCKDSAPSLFGTAAADYTDEQAQLVAVSQLYDNVREHPECPPESVLEDDDMFDGWLILERRKREGSRDQRDIESSIHDPRIKNAQEVIRVVGSKKEAQRVDNLNSPQTKAMLQKRWEAVRKQGQLAEQDLPEVKARMQLEKNRREFGQ